MTKKVLTNFGFKVNENEYSSWNMMRVDTSLNTLSDSFIFRDVDFTRGAHPNWKIKKSDLLQVFIEKETLITGYADNIPIEYGGDRFDISFIGRDKTSDLIDCSYIESNNEFKNITRKSIIERLCSPYGVSVIVDSSAEAAVNVKLESYKAEEGQKVGELISELCRDSGIIATSKGDGSLLLVKTFTEKATDPIQFDQNAIRAKLFQDDSNRYSDYIVKGYGNGADNKSLTDFISCKGKVSDPIIKRYRPLTIFAETATDEGKCKDRALWESRLRAGFSRGIAYYIPGWSQSDGTIWKKGLLVNVFDTILDIEAQEFLIAEVSYVYDEEGVFADDTDLTGAYTIVKVVDKDTYSGKAGEINIKTRFDE